MLNFFEMNFFEVWFYISPFIFLYLWRRKNKTEIHVDNEQIQEIEKHINETWDNDYKMIVGEYGTVRNFLQAHDDDFTLIREQIVALAEALHMISESNIEETNKIVERIGEDTTNAMLIKSLRNELNSKLDLVQTYIKKFVEDEEKVHSETKNCSERLEKISKKYERDSVQRLVR